MAFDVDKCIDAVAHTSWPTIYNTMKEADEEEKNNTKRINKTAAATATTSTTNGPTWNS